MLHVIVRQCSRRPMESFRAVSHANDADVDFEASGPEKLSVEQYRATSDSGILRHQDVVRSLTGAECTGGVRAHASGLRSLLNSPLRKPPPVGKRLNRRHV